ncbi:uncharacterized protein LOC106461431 isoform X2 [Limulus polyphemus]|uniref:Uncharacterized protein LOC106461431 isoform X2 n=1 Tax=Limulus polyphemus TaxID=6850 RepID=A0ABM1SKF4_LIMPO|nr:uncharacterized protein LOC106461431 isoform X2 [Limulus polyphemus]
MAPSMPDKETDSAREEKQARSVALEKAYVHDVYDQIAPHFRNSRYRAWPHVKHFLLDLEPGSLVADVGCGNGKYLDINSEVYKVGGDRCSSMIQTAGKKGQEALICDNHQLPFRDESFDAAISIAVIHHFATTERRVRALQELARILRIGGKVMITVWAMEQNNRKFDSQDVLVPWHQPVTSSSEDRGSSAERELTSTNTSDDDLLVYNAYLPPSDTEAPFGHVSRRKNRFKTTDSRYRSQRSGFLYNGSSSSELSSPNETCYSFIRRAFKKLTVPSSPYSGHSTSKPYFYSSCRRPWFSESTESSNPPTPPTQQPQEELHRDESQDSEEPVDMCIELRHLEEDDFTSVSREDKHGERVKKKEEKVWSLTDLLSIIPSFFRIRRTSDKDTMKDLQKRISTVSDPREYLVKSVTKNGLVRSRSTMSCVARFDSLKSLVDNTLYNKEKLPCVTESTTTDDTVSSKFTVSDIANGNIILPDKEKNELKSHESKKTPKKVVPKLPSEFIPTNVENSSSLTLPDNANVLHNIVNDIYTGEEMRRQNTKNHVLLAKTSFQAVQNKNANKNYRNTQTNIENNHETLNSEAGMFEAEQDKVESRLSSYYSMPELHTIGTEENLWIHENQLAVTDHSFSANRPDKDNYDGVMDYWGYGDHAIRWQEEDDNFSSVSLTARLPAHRSNDMCVSMLKKGQVRRSVSIDTAKKLTPTPQSSGSSTSLAQGLPVGCLRIKRIPQSPSRRESLKSDTSVDSEESIVSVIARKNNGVQSESSVDSEESIISVIQRSSSEIEALMMRKEHSRAGSRSAQASPLTLLNSSGNTSDSSPPLSASGLGTNSSYATGLHYSRPNGDQKSSQTNVNAGALERDICSSPVPETTTHEGRTSNQKYTYVRECEAVEKSPNVSPPKLIADKPFTDHNLHSKQVFTFDEKETFPSFDNGKKESHINTLNNTVDQYFIKNLDVSVSCQTRGTLLYQKNEFDPRPICSSRSLFQQTRNTGSLGLITIPAEQPFKPFSGCSVEEKLETSINEEGLKVKGENVEVSGDHQSLKSNDKVQCPNQIKLGENCNINWKDSSSSLSSNAAEFIKPTDRPDIVPNVAQNDTCSPINMMKGFESKFYGNDKFVDILPRLLNKDECRETTVNTTVETLNSATGQKRNEPLEDSSRLNKYDSEILAKVNKTPMKSSEIPKDVSKDNVVQISDFADDMMNCVNNTSGNICFQKGRENLLVTNSKRISSVVLKSENHSECVKDAERNVLPDNLPNFNEVNARLLETGASNPIDGTKLLSMVAQHIDMLQESLTAEQLRIEDTIVKDIEIEEKDNQKTESVTVEEENTNKNVTIKNQTQEPVIIEVQKTKTKDLNTGKTITVTDLIIEDFEEVDQTVIGSSSSEDKRTRADACGDRRLEEAVKVVDQNTETGEGSNILEAVTVEDKQIKALTVGDRKILDVIAVEDERVVADTSRDSNVLESVTVGDRKILDVIAVEDERVVADTSRDSNVLESVTVKNKHIKALTVGDRKIQENATVVDQVIKDDTTGNRIILETITGEVQKTKVIKSGCDNMARSVLTEEQRLGDFISTEEQEIMKAFALESQKVKLENKLGCTEKETLVHEINDAVDLTNKMTSALKKSDHSVNYLQDDDQKHVSMELTDVPEIFHADQTVLEVKQQKETLATKQNTTGSLVQNKSLSMSSSQESLQDHEDGAMTYHRYYHVFRQGELDSLIERYVENLHIISSYYDHANWCIIAEKVQVWTI